MIVAYLYICKFKIEHHQKFCHLFSTSNLTFYESFFQKNTLSHSFQNCYSNQTKHTPLGVIYEEDQDLKLRENWVELSPTMPKILNVTFLVDVSPHQKIGVFPSFMPHLLRPLIADYILVLMAFRQITYF